MRRGSIRIAWLSMVWIVSLGPWGCTPSAVDIDEVLKDVSAHVGKRVTVRAKFKSGARCRQGEDGEWRAYCKDCQYCRGPVVVDSALNLKAEGLDDWPLVLGGTWKGSDIRCKGPLNHVECTPFELGKWYVVRGVIENQHPRKLLVEDLWED